MLIAILETVALVVVVLAFLWDRQRRAAAFWQQTATDFANQFALYVPDPKTGCWEWKKAKDRRGYGRVNRKTFGQGLAHRVMYERHLGPIPDGLHLDHLCCNQSCVNPAHLEPVTHEENIRRYREGNPQQVEAQWARVKAGRWRR